ncbi:MAG: hypothetical protein F6K09_10040 [Merismopedia sp. SIO2A8]|nr:hypothetical protein [Merismopedia sp. SIO2A8]
MISLTTKNVFCSLAIWGLALMGTTLKTSALTLPKADMTNPISDASFIRPAIACPSDIHALTPLLLRDVPSYANRVSTRAQIRDRSYNPRGVVIVASEAELERLDPALNPTIPSLEAIASHDLIPFFFTTLERQYGYRASNENTTTRLQHYHWAFLTRVDDRWELAMMFSRIGDYPASQPVSPPRESRQGTIGQAIQLWLRDCNAGSVENLILSRSRR